MCASTEAAEQTWKVNKERCVAIFNRLRNKWNKVEIYFSLGAMLVSKNPHWEKFPCFIIHP